LDPNNYPGVDVPYVKRASFHGDVNIGLFGFASDKFVILPDKTLDTSVLDVPPVTSTISDTQLIGLFLVGNSKGIVFPKIVEESERENILSSLRELGLEVNTVVLKSKYTALGNLIVCNDKGAIVSDLLKSSRRTIEDALDVEVVIAEIAESKLPGSFCVATNRGFLLSNNGSEDDYELLKDVLKVDGDIGSVNFGSVFVRSGIIANSNGYVVGEMTTGVELSRIDEALGFIK
jgi:translation initiation factor 6